MADEKLRSERSVGLFAIAFLALNFPILSLFGRGSALFDVPVLYIYLFVLWALLILLSCVSLRQRKPDRAGGEDA